MRLLAPLALAVLIVACKKDRSPRLAAEAAPDGKAMVKGCVWFEGGNGDHDDTIAFCDDGRICVQSRDGWRCIQFAAPRASAIETPTQDAAP